MAFGGRQTQLLIAGLVVILDQAVKVAVRSQMDLYESISVIPGVLSLTRVHNTGAAFGMLNGADFPGDFEVGEEGAKRE